MIQYDKKFSLQNKKVVVIGGAGLIGKEVVIALAQAGARVIVADVNEEASKAITEELKCNKLKVEYQRFDITDLDSMKKNVDELVKYLGGLDVWVNSAYPRTKDFACPIEKISVNSWRKNVDMHLNSYALTSKYAAEKMKRKGGSIINFASIYGVVSNDPVIYEGTKITTSMAYTAIKGGIVNLDRFLAAYFGKYNIRVNTICPGGVLNNQDMIFVKNYSRRVPLKRMANAQEIASVVLFLASEAASYITGATIMVDGGWTAI